MPNVYTICGEPHAIYNDRDFIELLRERLGSDAVDYFRERILEHDDETRAVIENLKDEIEDVEFELDTATSNFNKAFAKFIRQIRKSLDKDTIDRDELYEICDWAADEYLPPSMKEML